MTCQLEQVGFRLECMCLVSEWHPVWDKSHCTKGVNEGMTLLTPVCRDHETHLKQTFCRSLEPEYNLLQFRCQHCTL